MNINLYKLDFNNENIRKIALKMRKAYNQNKI